VLSQNFMVINLAAWFMWKFVKMVHHGRYHCLLDLFIKVKVVLLFCCRTLVLLIIHRNLCCLVLSCQIIVPPQIVCAFQSVRFMSVKHVAPYILTPSISLCMWWMRPQRSICIYYKTSKVMFCMFPYILVTFTSVSLLKVQICSLMYISSRINYSCLIYL